ncbi:MAG: DNA internalization-related competence protein ComEC/Rec2 [Candidatus Marinimicrobia bacterium]|nr:DNA internalization-related competence protein ComEC/Rec2 [Candidatus Neomarinimicrobiota bacterium]
MNTFFVQNPIFKFIPFQIMAILLAVNFQAGIIFPFTILIISSLILFSRYYNVAIPTVIFSLMWSIWLWENPTLELENYSSQTVEIESPIISVYQTTKRVNYILNADGLGILYSVEDTLTSTPGDILHIRGKIYIPDEARNPGQFDARKYYKSKGVDLIFSKDSELVTEISGPLNINRIFFHIRQSIILKINKFISEPYTGMALGLLIGVKSEIDEEFKENFKASGIIHILAVSGLHVGYILLVLHLLGSIFYLNAKLRFLLILVGMIFYMGITGWPISVIRAGIMAILYAYAKLKEFKTSAWNILGVVGFVNLLIDPNQLFNLSFQLSFGAVAGILYSYGQLQILVKNNEKLQLWRQKPWFRWGSDYVAVSMGAQMGTFLPIAFVFGQIPLWSLFTNIFAIFLSALAVLTGITTLFFSLFSNYFANIYGNAMWGCMWVLDFISSIVSNFPYSYVPVYSFSTIFILLLLSLWILVMSISIQRYAQGFIIFGLIVMNGWVWPEVSNQSNYKFAFLDVGQGDACIIHNDETAILIDAGYKGFGKDYGKYVILPYLKNQGFTQIDLAIMSHPHADHIGGLKTILDEIPIEVVWDTYNYYESGLYQSIMEKFVENRTMVKYPRPGEVFEIDGLILTVLFPDSSYSKHVSNINNASIVVRIDHGNNSFLFTGDAETQAENIYSKLGAYLDVDVVKVGHHGSKTSSSLKIVENASPQYGIISLGKMNKYGHPSSLIMDRWKNNGATLFRTDEHGGISMKSDGKIIKISKMIE